MRRRRGRSRPSARPVEADEPRMTAFVFKIQANMDPNHRDRIAFTRLCSGKLVRGMKVKQVRTGKTISLHTPQFFFAQDRALADEAYAGDVVGIPNHGTMRIGDTLTEGEDLTFLGVPSFAPEILRRVRLARCHEGEETAAGAAADGGGRGRAGVSAGRWRAGARRRRRRAAARRAQGPPGRRIRARGRLRAVRVPAGALDRGADRKTLDEFVAANNSGIAEDLDGDLVFLARNQFYLDYTRERAPGIVFTDVKDAKKHAGEAAK